MDANLSSASAVRPLERGRSRTSNSKGELLEIQASWSSHQQQWTILAILLGVVVVLCLVIVFLLQFKHTGSQPPPRAPRSAPPQPVHPQPGNAQSVLLDVHPRSRPRTRLPLAVRDKAPPPLPTPDVRPAPTPFFPAPEPAPPPLPPPQPEPAPDPVPAAAPDAAKGTLVWFQCMEDASYTVFLTELRASAGNTGIIDGNGAVVFEAQRHTTRAGEPSLSVHLVYSQDALITLAMSASDRMEMDVYDQHGQVYGSLREAEDFPGYVLFAGSRPVLLLRQSGLSLEVSSAGGQAVASSAPDDASLAPRLLRIKVKPGPDLVLKLAAILAVSALLPPAGRREADRTAC